MLWRERRGYLAFIPLFLTGPRMETRHFITLNTGLVSIDTLLTFVRSVPHSITAMH